MAQGTSGHTGFREQIKKKKKKSRTNIYKAHWRK